MELLFIIVSAIVGSAIGVWAGYFWRNRLSLAHKGDAEQKAIKIIEEATQKSQKMVAEARAKTDQLLEEVRLQERDAKRYLADNESRLLKREELVDRKLSTLAEQEKSLGKQLEDIKNRETQVVAVLAQHQEKLQQIAQLTPQAAKDELLAQVRSAHQEDLSLTLQKMYKDRKEEIEKKSVEIMTTALQRYARSHVSEITTSLFPLKDDDLKGKIIGREGRNIRAIERATGVELIIDETPDSIIISSFDPYRREIAYMALEKLVKDGRIQPAKIEEKVEEARQELNKRMFEIGEAAATEVGVFDLPKEIVQLLGRLHFRTSFGQNVLTHSIEMAYISSIIAAELGLNVAVAKKGALLHDIGKAIDHEVEGTHVDLGRQLLKKYGIEEEVIWAMQSHHDDYPYASPESYIVTAADVLSAGRPGARRGTVENYIRRLADLEKIAMSFAGVKQAYAISAGRELRIFVLPEKIDDFRALELAREVANRVQTELKYPGEIKVNVIREVRAVEYAR